MLGGLKRSLLEDIHINLYFLLVERAELESEPGSEQTDFDCLFTCEASKNRSHELDMLASYVRSIKSPFWSYLGIGRSIILKTHLQSRTQRTRIEMVSMDPALFAFNIYIHPGFYPNGAFAYMQNTPVYRLLSYQPDFRADMFSPVVGFSLYCHDTNAGHPDHSGYTGMIGCSESRLEEYLLEVLCFDLIKAAHSGSI